MVMYGSRTGEMFTPRFDTRPVFEPTGLNDDKRVDLTDSPFLAIDPAGASEIDDAIRMRKDRAGFKLEVAIVDGSQLASDSLYVREAIQRGQTSYADYDMMLAKHVLDVMSLKGEEPKRALVVSQTFDRDLVEDSEPMIEPAWINVKNLAYGELSGANAFMPGHRAERNMKNFANRWLGRQALSILEGQTHAHAAGDRQFVSECMKFANGAVASWMRDREIPALYRVFDPRKPFLEKNGTRHFAHYSSYPSGHAAFEELEYYMHFTSPLRRAADLVNHLQVGAYLAGQDVPFTPRSVDGISKWTTIVQKPRQLPSKRIGVRNLASLQLASGE